MVEILPPPRIYPSLERFGWKPRNQPQPSLKELALYAATPRIEPILRNLEADKADRVGLRHGGATPYPTVVPAPFSMGSAGLLRSIPVALTGSGIRRPRFQKFPSSSAAFSAGVCVLNPFAL